MRNIFLILLLLGILSFSKNNETELISPNGNIEISIANQNNNSNIFLINNGDTNLTESAFGLLVNETDFTRDVSISDFTKTTFDETWKTINGKNPTVRNHYNEYKFKVSKIEFSNDFYEVVFRLFDDGFAYRYIFPIDSISDSLLISNELTKLNFKNDFTYWSYQVEQHNLGPIKRSEQAIENVLTPIVIKAGEENFMAIHEAEIMEFAPFSINASGENLSIGFNTQYSKRTETFKTSWRTFIIGKRAGDLVESNLLVNLIEPCKIEDPSWIKPGKSLWDWRVWGHVTDDGYKYGLLTESHKRFIDFASKNNIQYLLIDADWYGSEISESSDPTISREDVDILECMEYAKVRNVGIILYLNDLGAKRFGLENILKTFHEWGAVGIKYGFMRDSDEDKVKQTRRVVELCAKNKLMVNFHDIPIPPSGDRRTWPNLVTKEYGHAQADGRESHYPETAVNMSFINMITGPLDFTNGWFDMNSAHSRVKVYKELPGTVVGDVAKLIVLYTGWMVLPDAPEEYLKKDDLHDCIRKMPAQFDGFKVLDGEIDEFISVARKAGDDWFVGSLTNREARTITIDLSFLSKDKKYEATLHEDVEDSHYLDNKESYKISKQFVDSNTKLTVKMGAGAGNAI